MTGQAQQNGQIARADLELAAAKLRRLIGPDDLFEAELDAAIAQAREKRTTMKTQLEQLDAQLYNQ